MKKMVSIIIRTKNEERWIKFCLESVFAQEFRDFEVVVVDNVSTDGTLARLKKFDVKVVTLEKYVPGAALNFGIGHSSGDILVFLSGHCIPTDSKWLGNLIRGFDNEKIVGVYGRQLPMSFTSANDKRDLFITFGLDEKIQKKDSFFHNANSAIRRKIWETIPFDNEATNIEDRIWASQVQAQGYWIKYEPEAKVYHHHGIHHGVHNAASQERALSTLKVMEKFTGKGSGGKLDPHKMEIISLIPIRGSKIEDYQKILLKSTLEFSLTCSYVNKTIVLTESRDIAKFSRNAGAEVPFLRDPSWDKEFFDLSMLYQKALEKLEEHHIAPDLVVSLEPNFVLRPDNLIESLISEILEHGYDSIVPMWEEFNAVWSGDNGNRIDQGDISSVEKKPLLVSNKGLGLVVYPELLREGKLYGPNCGLYCLKNKFLHTAITSSEDYAIFRELQTKLKKRVIPK
jgi:glycosyltransferase involved in cell wall biosynthesis